MSVRPEHAVGFYEHPKLIHLPSGRVRHRWSDLDTGRELSSIALQRGPQPPLALDPRHHRFAVATGEGIAVISLPAELPV